MSLQDFVKIEDLKYYLQDPAVLCAIMAVVIASIALTYSLSGLKKKKIALNSAEYIPFTLIDKLELSRDTRRFRFALQSKDHILGLPIGQHISMKIVDKNGKIETRSYTPTSSDHEIGYVDFVIKVYFPNVHPKFPDGGKMSFYLENLAIGDTIDMRGPKGSLEYKGKGLFSMKRRPDRRVTKIGMIAGGTGITPMLQIMTAIGKEKNSNIEMSLLFANQTEEDILLRDMIVKFAEKYPNFKYHFTLDRAPEVWQYSTGFINATMIKEHIPKPGDDVLILMCGPPPMVKYACIENLEKLKYSEDMYFSF